MAKLIKVPGLPQRTPQLKESQTRCNSKIYLDALPKSEVNLPWLCPHSPLPDSISSHSTQRRQRSKELSHLSSGISPFTHHTYHTGPCCSFSSPAFQLPECWLQLLPSSTTTKEKLLKQDTVSRLQTQTSPGCYPGYHVHCLASLGSNSHLVVGQVSFTQLSLQRPQSIASLSCQCLTEILVSWFFEVLSTIDCSPSTWD